MVSSITSGSIEDPPTEKRSTPDNVQVKPPNNTAGFCVDFQEYDPENPRNWSTWYQMFAITAITYCAWATVLYSTCFSSGITGMMEELGIGSKTLANLGISVYLVGWSVGSLVLAPLSETFGRRPVYIVSLLAFVGFIPGVALANSFALVLIVRVLGSIFGGVMITLAPGSLVDIVPISRLPFAMAIYSLGPLNGPVTGPIIGGFVNKRWGWRGINWFIMIVSGVGLVFMCLIQESYQPVILRRRASQKRHATGDPRWWSKHDETKLPLRQRLPTAIWRPIQLCLTEPVLWFWNLYIAFVYAVLYLCFIAYPMIFAGLRHWSPEISGLPFVGVLLGNTFSVACEPMLRRLINSHPVDPATGKRAPEAAVSVIIIAAIAAPVGQSIFALTSLPTSIPWIASVIGGALFGFGNTIIFNHGLNYVAVSYGRYASSALVSNVVCRSVLAAGLVEAGQYFYTRLTPRVAGVVLAGIEFGMIPIPVLFYVWGHKLRLRSMALGRLAEEVV
ncbi:MFS general substrate transporter [Aspergillus heteromorphus CBS 117.55]|uniref:MFS general substrate transporter n=1 Tax=Aspergillus heteromorphus CBS 117.55 TaxID=1448321 RepID=A0A317X0S1_9EURO|nr:MFS general substrate transporter [Aspergillus heteromorphus CBS 117.55]PWY92196.1 MFS general substrate transporter [Aspergillus heteromorphus CBS 117.55]